MTTELEAQSERLLKIAKEPENAAAHAKIAARRFPARRTSFRAPLDVTTLYKYLTAGHSFWASQTTDQIPEV